LEAEILILRHQLNIQRRHLPKRLTFSAMDRLIFVGLSRLAPSTLNALTIVKPETVVRWHGAGFRSYRRWKSRPRSGRPMVAVEMRRLVREMSIANPLWGAPRIHGELLKLGIKIGQTGVANSGASVLNIRVYSQFDERSISFELKRADPEGKSNTFYRSSDPRRVESRSPWIITARP
jgi:hypothetical protein